MNARENLGVSRKLGAEFGSPPGATAVTKPTTPTTRMVCRNGCSLPHSSYSGPSTPPDPGYQVYPDTASVHRHALV